MNNELIERIDAVLESWRGVTVLPDAIYVLQDCKAALTEKREDEDHRELEYHLLASEMVYEGNSVQHWRNKALAYKECAGVIFELKQLLGVETPKEVLASLAQQQEAEPVGECKDCPHEVGDSYQRDCDYPHCLRAPKPAALPQMPEAPHIWVLTESYNDYDQHGYFVAAWTNKPTLQQIAKVCGYTLEGAEHVLAGGGRQGIEEHWYDLMEYEQLSAAKEEN